CRVNETLSFTRIAYGPVGLHNGTRRHRGGVDAAGAHDVPDILAPGQQVVGDDAAVAAPPNRFGAHDGAAPLVSDGYQLVQPLAKLIAHCIVGVVVKAVVLPETIGFACD